MWKIGTFKPTPVLELVGFVAQFFGEMHKFVGDEEIPDDVLFGAHVCDEDILWWNVDETGSAIRSFGESRTPVVQLLILP